MHEMSLVRQVVGIVLGHCAENDVKAVSSVHLTIGELFDVVEEYIPGLFGHLARGTVAEHAEVVIERVPATVQCANCARTFRIDSHDPKTWRCPGCGADRGFRLKTGREFVVDSIVVEGAGCGADGEARPRLAATA